MRISWDGEETMDIPLPLYFFGNHTSYVVSEAASRLDQHVAISEALLDYERYRFGVHLYVHLMLNVFQQRAMGHCFSCHIRFHEQTSTALQKHSHSMLSRQRLGFDFRFDLLLGHRGEVLRRLLKARGPAQRVVEIGVNRADTAQLLLKSPFVSQYIGVDP